MFTIYPDCEALDKYLFTTESIVTSPLLTSPASGFHSQVPVFCDSVDSWRKTLYKAVRGFAQTSLYRTYAHFLCLELPGKVISLKNVVYSICSQKICQCYETVKAVCIVQHYRCSCDQSKPKYLSL